MSWRPPESTRSYRTAEVLAIHDGYRADISMSYFGLNKKVVSTVFPNTQVMPHLHLEVGYRVIVTILGVDMCITDLFGVTHNWVASIPAVDEDEDGAA